MELEKRRSFIINFLYFLILIGGSILLLKFVAPVLSPFLAAFFIAYVLRRPTRRLCRKLGTPHKPTAIAVSTVFYVIVGGILTVLSLRAVALLSSTAGLLLHIYTVHIEPVMTGIFDSVEQIAYKMDPKLFSLLVSFEEPISEHISSLIASLSAAAMSFVSNFASSLPGTFVKIIIAVISTFFISADYQTITGFCLDQLSGKARTLFLHIKEYIIGTLFVCVRSYALIMCITFSELSIMLSVIKLQHAIPIAAFIAVFDILPVLGTGGIMIPWGLYSLLKGDILLGIELLFIYLIVTIIRNIIEPKIVGGQLGLHPVVTLASMTLGLRFAGGIGLFGFPILLSLLVHLNNDGTIKLFNTDKITARPDGERQEEIKAWQT